MNVIARHDSTHGDYQQQWNDFVPSGYRPISLSLYGAWNDPRYASVWIKRSGPSFVGIHGTTLDGYRAFFDQWAGQGFSPTILTATGPADNPVYAAVMEKSDQGVSLTRHSLRSGSVENDDTIQHWLREGQRKNLIPRWIGTFGTPDNRRYTLVLDPNHQHVLWNVEGIEGDDHGLYQQRFGAHASSFAWPSLVTVTSDGRYLSMFRDGDIAPWVARHGITSETYQQEVDTWWRRGYFPLYVQAGGVGTNARFACLFVQKERPAHQRGTSTGQRIDAFGAVDDKVLAVMRDSGTRAVGVAITRQGRLVHARGYTLGEPSYPVTQPETMFRIASCSKPITSMAIHRLIQEGRLRLTDRMQDLLNLQPPKGLKIVAEIGDITVHHLLTHCAGWDRDQVPDLPRVEEVARAFGRSSLPVTREEMARYKLTMKPEFTPGSSSLYSNFGFLLLGLIVDRLSPHGYAGFVHSHIFKPLGLTRPHLIRGPISEQLPGDARHYDNDASGPDLRLVWSPMTGQIDGPRPLVPLAYGGEDLRLFESFGGWGMAACDYVRILASFDLGDASPVLNQASLDMMWSRPPFQPNQNYVSGWGRYEVGNGVFGVQHGGGLPGVSSHILWQSDGWGYAVFGNGAGLPDIYPELSGMAPAAWPTHDLFSEVGIPSF